MQAFLQAFAARVAAAERSLAALQASSTEAEAPSPSPQQQLDTLAQAMLEQETQLAAAAYYLPAYDQKQCAAQVQVGVGGGS